MTDDLIKRLREYRIGCGIHCSDYNSREPLEECLEAADEIERLRAAARPIVERLEEVERVSHLKQMLDVAFSVEITLLRDLRDALKETIHD